MKLEKTDSEGWSCDVTFLWLVPQGLWEGEMPDGEAIPASAPQWGRQHHLMAPGSQERAKEKAWFGDLPSIKGKRVKSGRESSQYQQQ